MCKDTETHTIDVLELGVSLLRKTLQIHYLAKILWTQQPDSL